MENPQKVMIYDPHSGDMLTTHVDTTFNWSVLADQLQDGLCDNISVMDHNQHHIFTSTKQIGSLYLSKGVLAISDTTIEYNHALTKFSRSAEGDLNFEGALVKDSEVTVYIWVSYVQDIPVEILISSSPFAIRRRTLIKKLHEVDDDMLLLIEKATESIVKDEEPARRLHPDIISLDMFEN